jgi:hypothetical protein
MIHMRRMEWREEGEERRGEINLFLFNDVEWKVESGLFQKFDRFTCQKNHIWLNKIRI